MEPFDTFGDVASDIVETIGDAGDLIGDILKTIAPFLAAIPGVGTAFAAAIYAAGAIAAKDRITDAMIGIASTAMPPGIPRIAFDGATRITTDIAEGRSVQDSALNVCRQAAAAAGDAAARAFDSGLAIARGENVEESLIEQGRALAEQNGFTAAASYNAAVSIAQGHEADQVVIDVARKYVDQVGGSAALVAFDTAVALGYGKTLQEAAYIGLHSFVRGNNPFEKILKFVEQVGSARNLGLGVQQLLEAELATDFLHALSAAGVSVNKNAVDTQLKPYIDAIRQDPKLLERPAGELAVESNVNEAIIRAAQALMRRGDGAIDQEFLGTIKAFAEVANQKFDFSEKSPEANDQLALKGQQIMNAGARWRGVLLSDIRKRSTFTITHPKIDYLTNIANKVTESWEITDTWRRAFDIGIGTAEGTSDDNPQNHANAVVRSRLGANVAGFDAAEAIQFERTRYNRRFHGNDPLSPSSIVALAGAVLESDRQEDTAIARDARAVIRIAERRDDVVTLDDAVSTRNRARWTKIMGRKRVSIFTVLPRDEPKRSNVVISKPRAAAS